MRTLLLCFLASLLGTATTAAEAAAHPVPDEAQRALVGEVRSLGWIAYSARSPQGDWDIFVCRPDGSDVRNLTRTPNWSEFSPQFSRDGKQLLFRRIPPKEVLDNNHHGTQGQLIIAGSRGEAPRVLSTTNPLTWASWSPDSKQIATLSIKGIFIYDVDSMSEIKRLDRKGTFQQLTWSPDGRWLVGVANSYGTGWSIARINVETGDANAVNRVDCCTPDWFPDSKQIVFSWRPSRQKANEGYGWTQLWMADAEGKTRQLLYAEEGRHVYGGHFSPNGKYVLFTGNLREDGDPGNAGAPMGLMRLKDAPIVGGKSEEFRALHRNVNDGPVLVLPAGWEPCWTATELFANAKAEATPPPISRDAIATLSAELHNQGWLVFSAKTPRGDWDLYRMRPDGQQRSALLETEAFNEAGARVSPDGSLLLYYRLARNEAVNMTYGTRELVVSGISGANPVVWGTQFPWASWGPDGRQIACLTPPGVRSAAIQIVDVATQKVVRRLPNKHITQQLVWSPDGRSFLGTANGLGPYWNIGRADAETGRIQVVSEIDRYNCTPDWAGVGGVVYSRGIDPAVNKEGRAELWWAAADGSRRERLFAEADRHIYGAALSPDGAYCVFTRSTDDFGQDGDVSGFTLGVMRRADAPIVRSPESSTPKPWLDLGPGWEPYWTAKLKQGI